MDLKRWNRGVILMLKKYLCIILAVILLLYCLSGCESGTTVIQEPTASTSSVGAISNENTAKSFTPKVSTQATQESPITATEKAEEPEETEPSTAAPETELSVTKSLEVHFIDVGQADAILVKVPTGENMLIDAGNNADGDLVKSYLKDQDIITLDVVVGTHPHEDHIGGLDTVINSFNIGKVYMPQVMHTTKTYEDVLIAIGNKGLKVTKYKAGDVFNLGSAKCTILAPNSDSYEDLNNYSIVIRLDYGQTSFLFTGDAEDVSENEILAKKYGIKADVLKVGHHGSTSSTSPAFLKAVSPKYAVISVEKDNQYGHPDSIILNRLNTFGSEIYRTDDSGTIIAISDGKSITFDKKSSPVKENAQPPSTNENSQSSEPAQANTVYVTKTGAKYHKDGCKHLSKSKIPIDLDEAIASGYTPCSVCNPPVSSDSSTPKEIITKEESEQTISNSAEEKEVIVYITKTGAKYHTLDCSYLKENGIPIELSDAKNSGYTPCSRCNPQK
jgi:competence protein ComEC